MQHENKDVESMRESMMKIHDAGQYLLSIINDSLDYQRIGAGGLKLEPEIVRTEQMVKSITELAIHANKDKKVDVRKVGCVVTWAENGKIGVDDFIKSDMFQYDAVLMDIRMPVMNGLEASKAIRRMDRSDAKSVPIIAMTANAYEDDIRASTEAGMNGYLTKPFNPQKSNREAADKIAKAPSNGTVKLETGNWTSFYRNVIDALAKRPDVTVVITYNDEQHNRKCITIPAGTDLTGYIDDKGYTGYKFLISKLGETPYHWGK